MTRLISNQLGLRFHALNSKLCGSPIISNVYHSLGHLRNLCTTITVHHVIFSQATQCQNLTPNCTQEVTMQSIYATLVDKILWHTKNKFCIYTWAFIQASILSALLLVSFQTNVINSLNYVIELALSINYSSQVIQYG